MRWILLVAAVVGFGVVFTTGSPSLMGLGFLVGCGGLLGLGLALAASRIAQTAQSETALIIDPEISALRTKANLAKSSLHAAAPVARSPTAGDPNVPR